MVIEAPNATPYSAMNGANPLLWFTKKLDRKTASAQS